MNRTQTVLVAISTLALLTFASVAVAEPVLLESSFPSLGLGWGEMPYQASADVAGSGVPMINVTNPSRKSFALVRIVAWSDETGQSRWAMLNLEPGGSSTLSLEGAEQFSQLSFAGNGAFSVELLNATDDQRLDVPVERAVPAARADYGFRKSTTTCAGDWKLTCTAGGCLNPLLGPFIKHGSVVDGDQVYWNNNTPTGPWATIGDSNITADWVEGTNGCPNSVTNSLGHTYSVVKLGGGLETCPNPPCEIIVVPPRT